MKAADDANSLNQAKTASDEEGLQKQSREVTRKLVELFGDADQTSIKMQGSTFHADSGKFSGVTNPEAREKLRGAGLLVE